MKILLFYLFLNVISCNKIKENLDIRESFDLLNSNEDGTDGMTKKPVVLNRKYRLNDDVLVKLDKIFDNPLHPETKQKENDQLMRKIHRAEMAKSDVPFSSNGIISDDGTSQEVKDLEAREETKSISEEISLICSSPKKRSSLLLISTLDGLITAVDYNSGNILWTNSVGKEQSSLISSSLSKVDITANGRWVRLIPSLDGAIYKFDGEHITPLPLSADILLHSSYKFNEDTVITGSKATDVVGIDIETGKVRYSCSKDGCERSPMPTDVPFVVITKDSKIVRAVDLKNGEERWNFSVGQHHLQIVQPDCAEVGDDTDDTVKRLHFVVPEGLLSAEADDELLWTQKMPSPIVSAWKVTDEEAIQLDLFSNVSVPAVTENTTSATGIGASLYVGYHKDEFYVQESSSFKTKINNYSRDLTADNYADKLPKLKWQPYMAKGVAKTVVPIDDQNLPPLMIEYERKYLGEGNDQSDCMLTESGFYLFDDDNEESTRKRKLPFYFWYKNNKSFEKFCPINTLDLIFENLENKFFATWILFGLIMIGCLSFSCTCCWFRYHAVKTFFLVVLSYFFNWIFRLLQSAGVDLKVPSSSSGSNSERPSEASSDRSIEALDRRISEISDTTPQSFTSRLCNEFTAIECLGKGGFGYVFNAQHKVDATNYAIKRIKLPTRESSKVMREVYALAKLQHPHIVRYFSSWIETPPTTWESPFDTLLKDKDASFDPDNWDETETASNVTEPSLSMDAISSMSGNFTFDNGISVSGEESTSSNELNVSFRNNDDSSSIVFENSSLSESNSGICEIKVKSSDIKKSSIEPVIYSDVQSGRRKSTGRSESENLRTYLYIQMELCKQKTLREWMEENTSRDKLKILHTFNDIVHAVEYIHDQHLIHRDLKPSNIFFSNDGNVKVGDFGLVTTIVDEASQRMTNESILMAKRTVQAGTELYMSPEQKERRQYNHKVDIFSLGIILYEMLAPFGTEMERRLTLMKVRQRDFSDQFQDEFPKECLILNEMLSENADLRPTTRGLRCLEPLADLQTDLHLIDEEERYVFRTNSQRKRLNSTKEHVLL